MFSSQHPILDLGLIICSGVDSENIENWIEDLLKNYIEKFNKTLSICQVSEKPFNFQGLTETFYKNGIFINFLNWLNLYEEGVKNKPVFKSRFMWQLEKTIEINPEYFD